MSLDMLADIEKETVDFTQLRRPPAGTRGAAFPVS